MSEIPTATHSGEFTIFGITLRCHRLDDGEAVIEADDLRALFNAMAGDCGDLDEAEVQAFMNFQRGRS